MSDEDDPLKGLERGNRPGTFKQVIRLEAVYSFLASQVKVAANAVGYPAPGFDAQEVSILGRPNPHVRKVVEPEIQPVRIGFVTQ